MDSQDSSPGTRDSDTQVWKALADPNRRQILDLLRSRPRTTGELSERFDCTRYGVMKHLGVLEAAGLVLVRREGRKRWNHLNPVPIQRIYRRWIRPFEATPADALLRLKMAAEGSTPPTNQGETEMPATAEKTMQAIDIQLEIPIQAPPQRVWESLTRETKAWWPLHFYVGPTPSGFVIEDRVGGRVYEDWGGGEGMLWSTVTGVKQGEMLQWAGDLAPDYGGPARSLTTFKLVPKGEGTLLQFRDTTFGEISSKMRDGLEKGWTNLLEESFKPYVETGKRPERPQSVA